MLVIMMNGAVDVDQVGICDLVPSKHILLWKPLIEVRTSYFL